MIWCNIWDSCVLESVKDSVDLCIKQNCGWNELWLEKEPLYESACFHCNLIDDDESKCMESQGCMFKNHDCLVGKYFLQQYIQKSDEMLHHFKMKKEYSPLTAMFYLD